MSDQENIKALREAISLSPQNIPLRKHLADSLLQMGKHQEAEIEYRETLRLDPNNVNVKYGLARVFYQNLKYSEALVLIEEICASGKAPGEAYLLWCKMLRYEGNLEGAKKAYRQAIEKNNELRDENLEDELGILEPEEVDQTSDDEDVVEGRMRISNNEKNTEEFFTEIERPKTSFADVGGMTDLKENIKMQIIYPLKNPEIYKAYGKAIGGGILMYGPPGCGKTHIARAVAGEIKAGFISIGIQDVLDMWVGSSERNLHQIFEKARQNKPCVLFFDEVDALAASRREMKNSASRQTINQFLAELDGTNANNDGLLILAATNAPWHIDSAFRRPGRFDSVIFVPPPDQLARAEIYRIMLTGKPINDIDVNKIAASSDQFSGADIGATINMAVESKLKEAMKSGALIPLVTKDILEAIKKHKPTTKEWFISAKNHALYANESGLYDAVLQYLKIKKY